MSQEIKITENEIQINGKTYVPKGTQLSPNYEGDVNGNGYGYGYGYGYGN